MPKGGRGVRRGRPVTQKSQSIIRLTMSLTQVIALALFVEDPTFPLVLDIVCCRAGFSSRFSQNDNLKLDANRNIGHFSIEMFHQFFGCSVSSHHLKVFSAILCDFF